VLELLVVTPSLLLNGSGSSLELLRDGGTELLLSSTSLPELLLLSLELLLLELLLLELLLTSTPELLLASSLELLPPSSMELLLSTPGATLHPATPPISAQRLSLIKGHLSAAIKQ
jgi:hypothetical protein